MRTRYAALDNIQIALYAQIHLLYFKYNSVAVNWYFYYIVNSKHVRLKPIALLVPAILAVFLGERSDRWLRKNTIERSRAHAWVTHSERPISLLSRFIRALYRIFQNGFSRALELIFENRYPRALDSIIKKLIDRALDMHIRSYYVSSARFSMALAV